MAQVTAISTVGLTEDEWLIIRRKQGIGASEVGAMLGLSKYKTPYEVWLEKTAEEPIITPDTPAMKRGRMMEETVAQMYVEESGRTIRQDNKIRIHPDHPRVFSSLDRVIVDDGSGDGPGVLECKTVTEFTLKTWEVEIPPVYYVQIQQQLAVTGWKWGIVALLNIDRFELTQVRFERNEVMIATIISEIEHFWNSYVLPKVEPPMIAADYAKLRPYAEAVTLASDGALTLIQKINEAMAHRKAADDVVSDLKDQLAIHFGKNNILVDCNGEVVATWKTQTKKAYTVSESSSRVMRIK